MAEQNYKNHKRYYPPHHYVLYPVMGFLFVVSCVLSFRFPEDHFLWIFIAVTLLSVILLSLMLRQHYALINQNRIVRLEMRFRYYVLTQKRFEPLEQKLTRGQVFALRFAPDEELQELVERALKENLSPDEIKRSIKNWLPDDMRV